MAERTNKIELSKRLSAVAGMVTKGGCVADVGCDHGFVSIFLIQNGIADHVIAMDVNEGPLARAREHVACYGMEPYIELRLSDGVALLQKEDQVETVILAGMGGKLMERIISSAIERGLFIREYVLQPQSDWEAFRKFLREMEYTVIEEKMIYEEGKYYPVIKVRHRAERLDRVIYDTPLADAFGPLLLEEKSPVLLQYLQKEVQKFDGILQGMKQKGKIDREVQDKRNFLAEAITMFGGNVS